MYKVENAIILAAGRGKRLNELTKKTPKPLLAPKGKIIIEDIIEKLIKRKITNVIVVVGYKSRQFKYLKNKYNVQIVKNKKWKRNNNITSIAAVKNHISNSLIVNGDIIIKKNVFKNKYKHSLTYVEQNKNINEWLIITNKKNQVDKIIKDGSSKIGFFQREITFIDENMTKEIINNIKSFDKNEYYEVWVLELSKKYNLPFSVYEIKKDCVFDLDTIKEYNEYDQ